MATSSRGETPFGVYIHFPYCAERCPYCDFAIAIRRTIAHDRYLSAITTELDEKASLFAGRRAVSVYFGGGTPSLWRPDCVQTALLRVLERFPPPEGVVPEVTLECNPAELKAESLAALRQAGINRLSIGAQSFSRRHLRVLGRKHTPQEIPAAFLAARDAGFSNLSLDLMIGLIGQRKKELDADLASLLSLDPEHVSLYQLTVEPRTPLAAAVKAKTVSAPKSDAQAAAYDHVRTVLAESGYRHYEISNFARRNGNHFSRHNSLYWTGGEYLGLGVGAHSFRRNFSERSGERFANQRGLDPYFSTWGDAARPRFFLCEGAPGLALYEPRSAAELAREAVWLGLRRIEGFSCARFFAEYGVDVKEEYAEPLAAMTARGLLELFGDTLRLSQKGVLFADEVGAAFL